MSHVSQRPCGRACGALRALLLASTALAIPAGASAQEADKKTSLPPVSVQQTQPKPAAAKPAKSAKTKAAPAPAPAAAPQGDAEFDAAAAASQGGSSGGKPAPGTRSGSLTVPTTDEALADIQQTPGGVALVPDKAYKTSTPSVTLKDAFDYVPGVFVQPKWGEETRLSIRGSSLSRNYHLRSIQLYMNGMPINTADGYGDFQEIDPTAFRYIEVYKGANALQLGANSLGGAINFVSPTGYDSELFGVRADVGSFGFHKLSVSSGGVSGPVDVYMTGTWQEQDGFRDHSESESVRGSINLGYRLSADAETRFYLNANSIDQNIPGSVTKTVALTSPTTPNAANVVQNWQRNVDSVRLGNKTTLRFGETTLMEFGGFGTFRHLDHPIYVYIDNEYTEYGGFGRITDQRSIGGLKNQFVAGLIVHTGETAATQSVNLPGAVKGFTFETWQQNSLNTTLYFENTLYVLPQFALVAGTQFLHATRDLQDVLRPASVLNGSDSFDEWSPKVGFLWDVTRTAQVFGNVSWSSEVPSFDELYTPANPPAPAARNNPQVQRAITYEIGTRGRTPDLAWELSLYRANIENELQCTAPFPVPNFCIVQNVPNTIHQGIEAGLGAAVLTQIFEKGPSPDKLWVNLAYTFSDFRFENDPLFGNNQLPGAPRHFVRAELLYKHPSGVYVGPNVEWVPEAYFVDNANTLDTEDYALLGWKLGFDNGGKISAYIEGRNLTDEKYIASSGIVNFGSLAATSQFEPGTGRAVYGGVAVKW